MKIKVLIPIFCSVFLGFLLGKIMFNEYDVENNVFNEGEIVYFVQMGKYSSYNDMVKKIDKNEIDNLLYYTIDNSYHVYGGITKKEEVAEKIKKYYEKKVDNVIITERIVTNEQFLNILAEYDKITEIATSDNDLINIEKIVISNYKEMILET